MGILDKFTNLFDTNKSKRRSRLGVDIALWEANLPWYYRNPLATFVDSLPDTLVTKCGDEAGKISRSEQYKLLRNAKKALAMRSVELLPPHVLKKFDQRRDWNKAARQGKNVLETCFPSLQFSYATPLPEAYRRGTVDLVVSEKGLGRVDDIARSHSTWLDAVEAPKELYKYRLRINRIIKWAYRQKLVPVMMTLTTFHRWNALDGLLAVLREAWKDLLFNYSGRKRFADVDLQGWVRRLEITINDGDNALKAQERLNCSEHEKTSIHTARDDNRYQLAANAGWHPHYHVILLVPKDKLQRLSDVEQDWRDAWVNAVCKHYQKVFGEPIDKSYLPTFQEHGLIFSRYGDGLFEGQLRPVDTGDYMAKVMGCDNASIFGVESEMTNAAVKNSRTPFDLLRDSSLPAANVDLFVEYAFATKGVPAIRFSKGLEDKVNAYFREHPEEAQSVNKPCPAEVVVASLDNAVYQLLYRNFKLKELRQKIAEGYDSLCSWLKETYISLGVPELCEIESALPRPPS